MDVVGNLNTTCDLYHPTRGGTSPGVFELVYPDSATTEDLKCRRRPSRGVEKEEGLAISADLTDVIYFAPDASLVRDDKVVIDGIDYFLVLSQNPSEPEFQKWLVSQKQVGK